MKNTLYLLLIVTVLFSISKDVPKESHTSSLIPQAQKMLTQSESKEYLFTFENLEGQVSTLTMKDDVYNFSNIQQPIVMVALFSTWCPPCRGQIPHLTNLQKKFKKELFIVGALVHDSIREESLQKFIYAQKALFFVSKNQKENLKFADMITPRLRLQKEFPLPLMILFFKGKYFTHYEGSMPEEMIESDIQQLLIKLKK